MSGKYGSTWLGFCFLLIASCQFGVQCVRFLDTSEILQRNCSYVRGLHANLIRFITKEGFHRDLEDTVEVTVTNSPIPMSHFTSGECFFAILGKFRPDVFVDPYEIEQNPVLYDSIRVLNNWTDLENPMWLAVSNTTVFVQLTAVPTGNLIATVEVKMPIHFRYQRPVSHSRLKNRLSSNRLVSGPINPGGYVAVNIPLPKLLLRCENWDLMAVEEQCHTVPAVCSRHGDKDEMCSWISVPFKSNSKGNTVFIPVGDTDSRVLVTVLTLLVVLGGKVFLLMTLVREHRRHKIQDSQPEPREHLD
ncbi:unnamed protein product [Allacma fusca]|uniref:Phosphatidylinositol-glycan biosynthesis class X protein n=1 Tax=Allacma fusca TaxID=39272 RepID=A0A8J2K2V3_9HEXA|nr:unnamed protein product [Allacma fusca]